MYNNALFGFMVQKIICKKFNIKVTSTRLKNTFEANNEERLVGYIEEIVDNIFDKLNLKPVSCTTFNVDENNKEVPYNFILSDNSTLSIRTNVSGDKVAPRIVGQAGFEKLNLYFKDVYGKTIKNQDDIKHLIINHIDTAMPIFIDFLLDADYILWIFQKGDDFSYHLIDGNADVDMDFNKDKFSFTRNYDEWKESTTLKYENKSIAEVQVHKNRSFKFRFIMKNFIPLLISKRNNTETIGITAEKTICDIFNLKCPNNFSTRYSPEVEYQLEDVIKSAFSYLPKPIAHSGSTIGDRGGNSKCSYDFVLEGNKTLSLKTNIGKMVCPPEVGQPNDKTCYLYFKHLIDVDHIDNLIFKNMVFNHIEEMIPIYLEHMFDSDYLLWLFIDKKNVINTGSIYNYEIFPKSLGMDFKWEKDKFSFSKKNIDEWNESNTVYYDGISFGEFQVHNHRNCFKFRFNFRNLLKIIKNVK